MHEFVGTEIDTIHWRHGRSTRHGIWYAIALMKINVAQIILKYNFKFPEGQKEWSPNVYLDLIVEPNPKQAVLFELSES
jgi:hypothetical protein